MVGARGLAPASPTSPIAVPAWVATALRNAGYRGRGPVGSGRIRPAGVLAKGRLLQRRDYESQLVEAREGSAMRTPFRDIQSMAKLVVPVSTCSADLPDRPHADDIEARAFIPTLVVPLSPAPIRKQLEPRIVVGRVTRHTEQAADILRLVVVGPEAGVGTGPVVALAGNYRSVGKPVV